MRSLPLVLLVMAGCGLTPRTYCERVAVTTCARLFACTTDPTERQVLMSQYPTEANCVTTFQTRSECAATTEQSLCRGLHWNPVNAAACVQEIQTLPCEELSTYRPSCMSPCG